MLQNAVVDASVLVSAFLFPESVPGRVIRLAKEGVYTLHLSPILIEEVSRSLKNPLLKKPYGHSDEGIRAWRQDIKTIGKLCRKTLPDIGSVCRDPDDDHVIACAVCGKGAMDCDRRSRFA